MVVDIKYDPNKAKRYNLKDDTDFIERYLRKRVEHPGILAADIDIKPYGGQMHVDLTLYYDPNAPHIQEYLQKLEMFFMLKVDRIIVWKEPQNDAMKQDQSQNQDHKQNQNQDQNEREHEEYKQNQNVYTKTSKQNIRGDEQ